MWLSADEQAILQYLKCCGTVGASAREVCRKAASKDRWKEDERWAFPILGGLKDKDLIENTAGGCYRLPAEENQKLGERD